MLFSWHWIGSDQPAMAFTYVPVPVYNLGGMAPGQAGQAGQPGQPGAMPMMPVSLKKQ